MILIEEEYTGQSLSIKKGNCVVCRETIRIMVDGVTSSRRKRSDSHRSLGIPVDLGQAGLGLGPRFVSQNVSL